jgi:hypothetical protein
MALKAEGLGKWARRGGAAATTTWCNASVSRGERGLGVTSHGLRHQNLQRMFAKLTGRPAPVKGWSGYDLGLLDLAMREMVQPAGHSDPYKAGTCLGRLPKEPGRSVRTTIDYFMLN